MLIHKHIYFVRIYSNLYVLRFTKRSKTGKRCLCRIQLSFERCDNTSKTFNDAHQSSCIGFRCAKCDVHGTQLEMNSHRHCEICDDLNCTKKVHASVAISNMVDMMSIMNSSSFKTCVGIDNAEKSIVQQRVMMAIDHLNPKFLKLSTDLLKELKNIENILITGTQGTLHILFNTNNFAALTFVFLIFLDVRDGCVPKQLQAKPKKRATKRNAMVGHNVNQRACYLYSLLFVATALVAACRVSISRNDKNMSYFSFIVTTAHQYFFVVASALRSVAAHRNNTHY